ncbi:hypothetical protein PHYBLDRAFT_68277 [Phycomyces blakesleeanus NRRL 1555(-)]|uniref:Uncharacterized protein n=1 Tax=Phycomyces blakesleeanus (strain ATCC 8743b / DSM 1359 / FGSC 10004 / NBRC 33097 / NRRL 1555) TaxID=763407 RepID=A0A162N2U5_PHYB8|nr:hypothetical protein PHYBLDRAFT_68277 [Phycomyces blakesleeanus NRRL 1555(-)]OAD67908.1 hypothetical protein PHYBLDRAFT_68277 [Phycomyces blakesleeanus NRRL 1555(-)]|eukprot:XP_018285948.1 hypothetical protein PHYBLDRAFT_68277 [Phycomyces blakesleeanus NRRL 1555(-)]
MIECKVSKDLKVYPTIMEEHVLFKKKKEYVGYSFDISGEEACATIVWLKQIEENEDTCKLHWWSSAFILGYNRCYYCGYVIRDVSLVYSNNIWKDHRSVGKSTILTFLKRAKKKKREAWVYFYLVPCSHFISHEFDDFNASEYNQC